MSRPFSPDHNRPTLGTLVVGFLVSLVTWGYRALPDGVPSEVAISGYALAIAVVALAVGQAVQRVGDRAPWADETHRMAVAYALSLDPAHHEGELETLLSRLGLESPDEARRLVGLDPDAG